MRGIPPFSILLEVIVLLTGFLWTFWAVKKLDYGSLFHGQRKVLFATALIAFLALPSIRYINAKDFSEKIKTLLRPGDQVVLYREYPASLPFI